MKNYKEASQATEPMIQNGKHGEVEVIPRLENNQITTIPQGTFEEMSALNYLYLDFVCDCNVAFWSWLKSKSLDEEIVTCLDQHNIRLSSLNASDFDNCTYNFCYPDYCSNGGSCSQDSYGDLVCSCIGEWNGATCTNNSCHPDYCLNGGSCSQDSYGDLICSCLDGWTGAKCQKISCHPDYCSNGGSCSEDSNGA
ncbi:unnamed protein product [Mytilus edulis]|uniref:EGF-like domain-containing protein n=1 Tax=Mytilus edulis TaxID=6550 RepID=A0A8S3TS96_MYTED|nr:unnamed protein product [Mytilus edulis]